MTKKMIGILLIGVFVSTLFSQNSWIRINQLGYPEKSVKIAVLASKTKISVQSFQLIDILTGKIVFQSSDITDKGPYAGFKNTSRLDFTEFQERGTFYILADDIRSPNFTISNRVYEGAADFLLNYMRQQRCGYNPFLKDSCHTHDGFIVDHPEFDSLHIDVTGGWHDASDYLQYVTTSANATYQMLFAYQQNPAAFRDKFDKNGLPGRNGIPDILDEAKWGLDWLDKMNPEDRMMFNQIADDRDHTKFTLPTLDSVSYGKGRERPVYFVTGKPQGLGKYKNRTTGVSSTAAKYASAFALGGQLLKTYYPEFCAKISQKALTAYVFANSDLGVCQTACNRSPYFYEEDNYVDDIELAAAQLYKLTGKTDFLSDAVYWGELEPITPWMKDNSARHYQWYPFVNLGHYLIADSADSLNSEKFLGFLKKGLEEIQLRGKANGFSMGIPFIWCSNNLVAAALTQINLYRSLSHDTTFDEMEAALRDWLFGCNPWGTSMIVGYPEDADTPTDPHSAFTAVFSYKIDGGLIDGPVYSSIFNRLKGLRIVHGDEYAEFQSDLNVYHDDYGDYSTNEPTMDGTASLSYYLSAMEKNTSDQTTSHCILEHGGIVRGDTTSQNIHLIFTGHEYNDGGEHIRKILKQHDIRAHFFFTGDFYRAEQNTGLLKNLITDGHYLGAHSDKHLLYSPWENRDSLLIGKQEFIDDLKNNYRAMAEFGITKAKARLFLPPYEWYNETISNWTDALGLVLINYTAGTLSNADYTSPDLGEKYIASKTIYTSILDYEDQSRFGLNGFFLLLHIGVTPQRPDKFYYQLNDLIVELIERGYRFTTIEI
jgi:peptidoglycan/xylan/chitin deacetylase (PgdA/CDA1 family)